MRSTLWEGAECYSFAVGGVPAFSYEVRGSEAYVVIDGEYYRVNNPSTPAGWLTGQRAYRCDTPFLNIAIVDCCCRDY